MYIAFGISLQGGITCGAIDEPRKSSKAIDERVIINFRDKNVVNCAFLRQKCRNCAFSQQKCRNWMGILPLKKRVNRDKCSFATKQRMFGVFAIDEILRYRGTRFPGSRTLCHPGSCRSAVVESGRKKGEPENLVAIVLLYSWFSPGSTLGLGLVLLCSSVGRTLPLLCSSFIYSGYSFCSSFVSPLKGFDSTVQWCTKSIAQYCALSCAH